MKKLTVLASLILAFANASAATITFDPLEQAGGGWALQGKTYTENGFKLVTGLEMIVPQKQNPFYKESAAAFVNYFGDALTLTKVDGGIFSLASVDLAILEYWDGQTVSFLGVKQGGATVTQSFVVDQSNFSTFNFAAGDFSGLTSVSWNQGPNPEAHMFDNIAVVAEAGEVPEPLSLTLVGIGLAGLAAARRRQSAGRSA